MGVAARTYKGYTCNYKTEPHASARLAAVILVAFISAVINDARAQVADTIVISGSASARIDFKVNLIDFDKTYHGNDSTLNRVLAEIDSMVLNPRMKVEEITVVGTASPEGPYANNVRLATGRAKALIAILRSRYPFPDSIYKVSTIAEDWEGMRGMLVSDNTIPYAGTVLKFLAETGNLDPNVREYRLKRLEGGRPYASMRDNVLPWLRRATVLVDYDTDRIRHQAVGPAFPLLDAVTADLRPRAIALLPHESPRRRFFSIKTNLLGIAALCANLGFEIELWPHWSLDVPVWYSPYDITERWRIRLLAAQPEVRWWPKNAGTGHYFGIHTTIAGFNISTCGDYRYQDPNHAAFGLGIGYGYAFHLDKSHRWGLEAQIGAGYVSYKWIKYHNTGRNGAEISHSGGKYWGITRAGLTLSYKFYCDRKERRWMKW